MPDYSKKSYQELKALCSRRDLENKGKAVELIDRLKAYDQKQKDDEKRFKVYVKTLSGSCYTIYVEPTGTVLDVKKGMEEKMGAPPEQQILYFTCRQRPGMGDYTYPDGTIGKKTEDAERLDSLNVYNESFFHLHIRMVRKSDPSKDYIRPDYIELDFGKFG